jgi:predicted permease
VTSSREHLGLRRALVASQIAVSLVLLVGTLLFLGSFRNLSTLDPGFQQRGLLVADVDFLALQLPPGRAVSFRRELLERLRAIPSVEAAAELTVIPLTGGNWNNRVWMDGSDSAHARVSLRNMVGTEYFQTMRTPLLAGRAFDEHDLTSWSKIAVVNEEFARAFMGGLNPVGRRFWIEANPYQPQAAFEIVGLVKNTKYRDLREEFQPVLFVPLTQAAIQRPGGRFMIRSNAGVDALVSAVRKTLAGISPDLRYSFHVFDKWVEDSLLRERLMATLSGLFGILAVALTAMGLYGVISYTVARRTNEIGVRIALGADRSAVIALILREAAVVLAAGLGAGMLLALAAGRAAAALLFGLESYDPLTLAIAGISLATVAAAASFLPAWRASSVNPVIALRQE